MNNTVTELRKLKNKGFVKADLHIHTKEDPMDIIDYTAKTLIDKASSLGFDFLSITLHEKMLIDNELTKYAKKKGILLIPGIEKEIQGSEVLIYNISNTDLQKIKDFNDLRILKKKNQDIFVIAPHPYYGFGKCLGEKLEENIDVFDAIEYSWFYTELINKNNKAVEIARKYNKPLITTSDCHCLFHFGRNYIMVRSEKNIKSFFQTLRKNKKNTIIHFSAPKSNLFFGIFSLYIMLGTFLKSLRQLPKSIYIKIFNKTI